MAGVGIAFLFVLFALVAPLALYWFVREEDPDPDRTTSWNEARERASEDVYGNRNQSAGDRNDRRRASGDRDDRRRTGSGRDDRRRTGGDRDDRRRTGGDRDDDDGNHWG